MSKKCNVRLAVLVGAMLAVSGVYGGMVSHAAADFTGTSIDGKYYGIGSIFKDGKPPSWLDYYIYWYRNYENNVTSSSQFINIPNRNLNGEGTGNHGANGDDTRVGSIAIGEDAYARTMATSIGAVATAASYGSAFGGGSFARDSGTAIGTSSFASASSVSLGYKAEASSGIAIGARARSGKGYKYLRGEAIVQDSSIAIGKESLAEGGIAIGNNTNVKMFGIAIGSSAKVADSGIALGPIAKVTVSGGIALGPYAVANREAGQFGYVPDVRVQPTSRAELLEIFDKRAAYDDFWNKWKAKVDEYNEVMRTFYAAFGKSQEIDETIRMTKGAPKDSEDYKKWQEAESQKAEVTAASVEETKKKNAWLEANKEFLEALGKYKKDIALPVFQANDGAVSIGSEPGFDVHEGQTTRQIINVAAGSADTDAVNVAQLKRIMKYIHKNEVDWKNTVGYVDTSGNLIRVANDGNIYKISDIDGDTNAPKPDVTPVEETNVVHRLVPIKGTAASRLTNVADGTDDHDAVNVSQLNAFVNGNIPIYTGGSYKDNAYTQKADSKIEVPLHTLSFDFGNGLKATKVTQDGKDIIFVGLDTPATNNNTTTPATPDGTGTPSTPDGTGTPGTPGETGTPGTPGGTGTPSTPGGTGTPSTPGGTGTPGTPGGTGTPGTPDGTGTPATTGGAGGNTSAPDQPAVTKALSSMANDITRVQENCDSGIASAMAAVSIPQVINSDKRYLIGAGVGMYGNKQAVAIGISGTNESRNVVFKVAGTYADNHKMGLSAGVGLTFGPQSTPKRDQFEARIAKLEAENKELRALVQQLLAVAK